MPTPAFPHDHTPEATRRIWIDDKDYPYGDQVVWAGVATLPGLPATAVPLERTDTGLPVGVQIVGPYLEDRTTLAFARLVEVEFGRIRSLHALWEGERLLNGSYRASQEHGVSDSVT